MLDLKDCVVTLDAMGCQHEVLDQITASEGDYLVSLKGIKAIYTKMFKNITKTRRNFMQKYLICLKK
jgi:predicted transposase YbfD/YdcC